MIIGRLLLSSLAVLLAACAKLSETNCGCECCKGKEVCCCHTPADEASDVKRHALRGVVMNTYPERREVLVKHEEIPGVMRAMTMLFKVDAALVEKVGKDDTITAQMFRQADEWWLEDVKTVTKP